MKIKRNALTLTETLVIIAIVVLIPAGLMASLETARHLAKIPLCANNLRQIGAAVYDYAQIYDGNLPNVLYPPPSTSEETHFYAAYRAEHLVPGTGKLWPYRFACLYEAGLIEDPRLFYCPAQTYGQLIFQSYNNPQPWGTLPQVYNSQAGLNQWVRSSYEWLPVDTNPDLFRYPRGGGLGFPTRTVRKFENIDPNLPYCTEYLRTKERISHQYDGVLGMNLLYSDGRVAFQDDPNVFSHPLWQNPDGIRPAVFDPYEVWQICYYRILLLAGRLPSQGN